jgi:hypothetical protein
MLKFVHRCADYDGVGSPQLGDQLVRLSTGGPFGICRGFTPDTRHIGCGKVWDRHGTKVTTYNGCAGARLPQAVNSFLDQDFGNGPVAKNTAVEDQNTCHNILLGAD